MLTDGNHNSQILINPEFFSEQNEQLPTLVTERKRDRLKRYLKESNKKLRAGIQVSHIHPRRKPNQQVNCNIQDYQNSVDIHDGSENDVQQPSIHRLNIFHWLLKGRGWSKTGNRTPRQDTKTECTKTNVYKALLHDGTLYIEDQSAPPSKSVHLQPIPWDVVYSMKTDPKMTNQSGPRDVTVSSSHVTYPTVRSSSFTTYAHSLEEKIQDPWKSVTTSTSLKMSITGEDSSSYWQPFNSNYEGEETNNCIQKENLFLSEIDPDESQPRKRPQSLPSHMSIQLSAFNNNVPDQLVITGFEQPTSPS